MPGRPPLPWAPGHEPGSHGSPPSTLRVEIRHDVLPKAGVGPEHLAPQIVTRAVPDVIMPIARQHVRDSVRQGVLHLLRIVPRANPNLPRPGERNAPARGHRVAIFIDYSCNEVGQRFAGKWATSLPYLMTLND
jgi:hypothetical protein